MTDQPTPTNIDINEPDNDLPIDMSNDNNEYPNLPPDSSLAKKNIMDTELPMEMDPSPVIKKVKKKKKKIIKEEEEEEEEEEEKPRKKKKKVIAVAPVEPQKQPDPVIHVIEKKQIIIVQAPIPHNAEPQRNSRTSQPQNNYAPIDSLSTYIDEDNLKPLLQTGMDRINYGINWQTFRDIFFVRCIQLLLIALIMFFLSYFAEIITFTCCNLNYNTRYSIIQRSITKGEQNVLFIQDEAKSVHSNSSDNSDKSQDSLI